MNEAKEIELKFTGMFKKGSSTLSNERNRKGYIDSSPVAENAIQLNSEQFSTIPDKIVPLYREAERRKQDHQRSIDVFKTYQENTLRSEERTSQLVTGMESGDDIKSLFMKAVDIVALLTNDNAITESAKRYMRTVYGIQSERERPLQRELDAINKTLFYLDESILWETDADELRRIHKAIETHERRAEALEAEIKKGRESIPLSCNSPL